MGEHTVYRKLVSFYNYFLPCMYILYEAGKCIVTVIVLYSMDIHSSSVFYYITKRFFLGNVFIVIYIITSILSLRTINYLLKPNVLFCFFNAFVYIYTYVPSALGVRWDIQIYCGFPSLKCELASVHPCLCQSLLTYFLHFFC